MLISQIGLLEPIQNQDHGIIPGCPRNPYRFIHTKCPLSPGVGVDRPSMRADGRFEGVRLKSFGQPPLLEPGGLEAVFFEPLHVRRGVHSPFRAGKQESLVHLGLVIATIT